MDTKLKSLDSIVVKPINNRQLSILTLVFVVLTIDMGMFSDIFYRYSILAENWEQLRLIRYYLWGGRLCFAATLFLCVPAFACLFQLKRSTHNTLRNIKRKRFDSIPTEAAALTGFFCFMYIVFIQGHYDFYIMGNYCDLHSLPAFLWAVIVFTFQVLLLLACIILIVRQYFLNIIDETSVFVRSYRLYKNRTPVEMRLAKRSRISLYTVLLLTAVSIIQLLYAAGNTYIPEVLLLACLFMIVILILYIKNYFSLKRNFQIGCLINHIDAMARGEDIPKGQMLNKGSLLYETDCKLQDIETAVKNSARKQLQAERLKMELITNVSHDLKTPLTSMVAYTDLLKKEELGPLAMDYVEAISMKQEQLKDMIQSVFELSKSNSGVEELIMEVLDMKRLAEQMLGDMDEQIKKSGFIIKSSFTGEDFSFRADNKKMYRVMQNIFENALKYSLEGTRIYISVNADKNNVSFIMKNISSYELDFCPDDMLERFARADKARSGRGNGLGLAIANSYIQNMGGKLGISVDGDLFKIEISFPYTKELD